MACKKYTYAAGDTAWVTTFMEAVEKSWKGLSQVTLTNYDTTVACSIEEGSVLEVAGSLYIATSDCAIGTAGISTALQYIQAIGSATGCVFSYNATAPTWRDDYQGYYASAGSSTRVVGGIYYTGSYTEKWVYGKPKDMNYIRASGSLRPFKTKVFEIGDWNMDATATCTIAHGLDFLTIRMRLALIRPDSDVTQSMLPLEYDDGQTYLGVTNITLTRYDSKQFDHVNYNATSYNRGYITLQYEDGQ